MTLGRSRRRGITSKLLLYLFLISIVPLVIAGVSSYRISVRSEPSKRAHVTSEPWHISWSATT